MQGYIVEVEEKRLNHFFSVIKAEDIIMVYNGMSIILNEDLWANHFVLPTMWYTLQAVERGT